ncbi:MAG: AAA family ATPase [Flammeovirgaceae bacterium]
MQRYPIGIQDFRKLREGNYLYIDKTKDIFRLTQNVYYFLSRPRRFGKSLLISTLAELYKGSKALFEGLWIADQWDWTKSHPVIEILFNNASYKVDGLENYLKQRLHEQASLYSIALEDKAYPDQFKELILQLSEQVGKVVILIDEYDKPIIDYLDDIPKAIANREILKSFYSVLKPLDAHLEFVFLTGVSKFSRVSIFSELNNLLDLTLNPKFSTLVGYTQEELEHYFAQELEAMAENYASKEALLAKIQEWYNGYSWNGKDRVYNPFSILNFFHGEVFQNFWFETGTPTFLVKQLNKNRTYQLEQIQVGQAAFSSFDIERIDPNALLFQTGYITIQSVDEYGIYTLGYPNKEVRDSLLQYLLADYSHEYASNMPIKAVQMKKALDSVQIEGFVDALNSLFASIPYQLFIKDKEAYYHSVTFLALSLVGVYVQVEPSLAKGRPDAVVHTENAIYVIEFKLDESAAKAIEQIHIKGYAASYQNRSKTVRLLGLNLNSEQKAIDEWIME